MASDVAFEQYKKFLKEQSDNAILRKALGESNKRSKGANNEIRDN